jgi:ring-1,2-phenylacetyl-CoA epoxidase subunit PaaE
MSLETTFHRLKVSEVRRETADSVSIAFETPKALADVYRFLPGQHLTVRALLGGEDLRRSYSVCVSPLDAELRVAVKRLPGGRFSTWANQVLQPGDEIEVMAPTGHFTWAFEPTAHRRYLGIAAGSGITPVMSLLETALRVEPKSHFTLLYGNRDSSSIMFLEALAALKNRFLSRLSVFHFLTGESEEVELFNGRLDATRCGQALDKLTDARQINAAFVCGPGGMMDAAEKALLSRGVPPDRILVERFTTGPISAAQAAVIDAHARKAQGAQVSVVLDGRRAKIAFDPAKGAILDNVRGAGLPAPYACKGGVCATCRAKVVEGSVEMKVCYGLTPAEIEAGYVLTCQSIPTSPNVVLSYDD